MPKRTLYQCFNARVKDDCIYCAKGHKLGRKGEGTLNIQRLIRGASLACSVCQDCPDFDSMGDPIPREERGWLDEDMPVR